jgi:hypothetical protein
MKHSLYLRSAFVMLPTFAILTSASAQQSLMQRLAVAVRERFGTCACAHVKAPDEASPLRQRLEQMDALRAGASTAFGEVENQGRELLRQYKRPEERAQIYFELAHVYAQSDIRLHPDRVARYARLALTSERDPIQRGVLYSYLGSAAEVDPTQLTFKAQRAKAAAVWLRGYKELLPLHLPATAPELPVIEKQDSDVPNPADREAARLKQAAQIKARQGAERLQKLIANRNVFVQQLKEVYAREPRANAEITRHTLDVLKDRQAADALLTQILPK